jgi:hypothetical protein
MVVQGNGKRLAVECDGDRWHPIEKLSEDMDRQAILERLGWVFARIRGSAFFRDSKAAMLPVFERLEELGIAPHGTDPAGTEGTALLDELRAQAAKFRYARDKPDEEAADDESPDIGTSQSSPASPADLGLDLFMQWNTLASSLGAGTNRRLQSALQVESTWDEVVEELHRTQPELDIEQLLREAARSKGVKRIGWRIRQEIRNAIKRVLG